MTNINRVPRGFLSYLDSQTQGENPSAVGSVVAPILNMEPFYRSLTRYEFLFASGLVDSVPSAVWLPVPQNEMWLLHQISGSILNATGATAGSIGASLVMSNSSMLVADFMVFDHSFASDVLFLQYTRLSASFPSAFVIPPGSSIGLFMDRISTTGPGLSGTVTACFNRLQV